MRNSQIVIKSQIWMYAWGLVAAGAICHVHSTIIAAFVRIYLVTQYYSGTCVLWKPWEQPSVQIIEIF